MADDLATSLVKQRESYRSHPYWDVNHWRVGYGSDTTTDANGRVHKVTKDTVTTRADADRDLARRIPAFQEHAASVIGRDAWNALPEESKAGITSVAYNYGSLNKLHSLVRAAQTGDPQAISRAILNRADDNGGVNAQRRQAEAAVVLGHPVPLGTIPDQGVAAAGKVAKGTNFAVAGAPLPAPAPLTVKSLGSASGQSLGSRLPQDATFGIQDRLNSGQKAQLPTDFQTLFAHGAPVDARTMSLAAPARFLGAAGNVGNATTANGSAAVVPGRSLGQPGAIKTTMAPAATVQMAAARPASVPAALSQLQLLGQPANSSGSPDDRDAAQIAALKATKPSLTVPKATYAPPANNKVGAAPAPQKQGLFQSLGGAIGSGMTALGNSANDAAKYLGKGVRDTVAAIPDKAQEAADYLTPLVLGNLEARSAFLDPMIARLGSPTAGDRSPTRYGATFQDRQQAAQDRERLSQGLPPQQRQSQPQPQPQQRQQAPVITTTFRNTSPAPKASPAPANNNGGGGGGNSGGGNGGGQQTITGSATGRSYTVGATYSNKDGNFVAQSNGTFKKVS